MVSFKRELVNLLSYRKYSYNYILNWVENDTVNRLNQFS
jgi:hypothetical protein